MNAALAVTAVIVLAGCTTPHLDAARAFSGYQPLCLFLCFVTAETTQAEGGDATGGKVSNELRNRRDGGGL